MAVAASRSIQGARRISTGSVGSASRWLVSFSVAARLPEMSRAAGAPSPSKAASPSASAVSMARKEMSSIATGQPRRRASIARATSRAPIRARIPSSAGHGRTAASSCGRARRPCARWRASPRRRSPTYGRAGGRGRSSSSRASGSSTRCGGACGAGWKWRPRSIQSLLACSRVSASTSTGVWLTTLSSCLWLQTSHSSGATLKSPTMIVGQSQRLGPARHPLDEVELLAELGIERRGRGCRRRRARRHSRAGSRNRAGRRHGAPRHSPASRAGRPRASAAGWRWRRRDASAGRR